MLRMTLDRELRALDGIDDSGSWISKTTLGHELKALNGMDDFG